MFGRGIMLGRPFGIPVRIDASWTIIAVLVTWSLAVGFFPHYYGGLDAAVYWVMAICGALGLFASILFHEFAHALVARRFGVEIRSVTLFIFGGVGDMRDEPRTPGAEFWIAVAGPASSSLLAALFAIPFLASREPFLPLTVHAVVHWMLLVNTMLAIFNMVPAFPLDGGRVLRSFLWRASGSLRRATQTSSQFGSGFGVLLMVFGGLQFLAGNVVGGIWLFFIGLWVRRAAKGSYTQLLLREFLQGEPVRAFMKSDPVTVPAATTVERLVFDYVYPHQFKMFPVIDDGRLLGCVTLRGVAEVPRAEWTRHSVDEFVIPCSDAICVGPETDVMETLATMRRTGNSRFLVVDDGRLLGVLALKDVLRFFALKMELEGGEA